MTTTNTDVRSGATRITASGTTPVKLEADYEEKPRQTVKTQETGVSTSTKLAGTNRVTPPLVTPLVDNGTSIEEALTDIVDSMGKQSEQMSIRMSVLVRAVHVFKKACGKKLTATDRESVGAKNG